MEPFNRRTFFFLGLGLMAGKLMYRNSIIYKPSLKQIEFINSPGPRMFFMGDGAYRRLYDVMNKGELLVAYEFEPSKSGIITSLKV